VKTGVYARWVGWWEQRLASRDNNRTIRPFEWGLEWLGCADPVEDPSRYVSEYARNAASHSGDFFSYRRPSDFAFDGSHLGFTSPLASPYPENNRVHAALFPASRDRGRAVVVLPQWNADSSGHAALCRLLNRFGLTALRMSLAYHDKRTPAGLQRADYHVSSNVGRTIHASRQSVIDARACLDWLEGQGYNKLGILGTSLGSCIAFIVAAHDARVRVGVFNHVSMQFGDVVWTGLATRHVRQGLSRVLSQDELREYWAPISPATYLDRLEGRDLNSLLVWARYDTTFLPAYSREFIEAFRASGYRHDVATLPCGHYTTGEFPFNLLDAFHMCRFLGRHL
jgi:hypothetical protein